MLLAAVPLARLQLYMVNPWITSTMTEEKRLKVIRYSELVTLADVCRII